MALCSNSTSLLELAFGVNAVCAALGSRVADVRTQLEQIVISNFRSIDPQFDVSPAERVVLESWVARGFEGYKIADRARYLPQLMSVGLMSIAAGTLYQSAIWEKCFIDNTTLGVLTVVALIVAPATYFCFGMFLRYVVQAIATKTFKNREAVVTYLATYRLALTARATLDDVERIFQSVEEEEARLELSLLKQQFYALMHPVQALRNGIRRRRLDKRLKNLD